MSIVNRTPGEQEAWRAGFEAGSHLAAGGTGIFLTSEEAALAAWALRAAKGWPIGGDFDANLAPSHARAALAARLEAAS